MTDKPQDTISPEDADELMDAEEAWALAHEIDATVPGASAIAEAGPWHVGVKLKSGQRLTFDSREEWEEWWLRWKQDVGGGAQTERLLR